MVKVFPIHDSGGSDRCSLGRITNEVSGLFNFNPVEALMEAKSCIYTHAFIVGIDMLLDSQQELLADNGDLACC